MSLKCQTFVLCNVLIMNFLFPNLTTFLDQRRIITAAAVQNKQFLIENLKRKRVCRPGKCNNTSMT